MELYLHAFIRVHGVELDYLSAETILPFIFCKRLGLRILALHTLVARFRLPAGQDFSLLHGVQTGCGAHPASDPMGTGGDFPGGKAAGA
jgi:hypothetical protein